MTTTPTEVARQTLRARHQVRLVESHEEGTAAGDLPHGVYGFTGSPALAAPLFAQRRYRNFEIHHLPDGEIAIIGFVTPEVMETLRTAHDPVPLMLFPDVEGDATEIVAVPYSSITHHRQYSVRNAAGMEMQVRPVVEFSAI